MIRCITIILTHQVTNWTIIKGNLILCHLNHINVLDADLVLVPEADLDLAHVRQGEADGPAPEVDTAPGHLQEGRDPGLVRPITDVEAAEAEDPALQADIETDVLGAAPDRRQRNQNFSGSLRKKRNASTKSATKWQTT